MGNKNIQAGGMVTIFGTTTGVWISHFWGEDTKTGLAILINMDLVSLPFPLDLLRQFSPVRVFHITVSNSAEWEDGEFPIDGIGMKGGISISMFIPLPYSTFSDASSQTDRKDGIGAAMSNEETGNHGLQAMVHYDNTEVPPKWVIEIILNLGGGLEMAEYLHLTQMSFLVAFPPPSFGFKIVFKLTDIWSKHQEINIEGYLLGSVTGYWEGGFKLSNEIGLWKAPFGSSSDLAIILPVEVVLGLDVKTSSVAKMVLRGGIQYKGFRAYLAAQFEVNAKSK